MELIRVALSDPNPLVRRGLRQLVAETPDMLVVGEASCRAEVLRLTERAAPHVLVLGTGSHRIDRTGMVQTLQRERPSVPVLALGTVGDPQLVSLLRSGVAGYALYGDAPGIICAAIRALAHGERGWISPQLATDDDMSIHFLDPATSLLTPRETDVLCRIAWGWDNKRIAADLCLTTQTVRNYASHVCAKLGVRSRAEAILWARDRGRACDCER